jgi:hypothetical protein
MDARREEESWWNKKDAGKSRTQASTFEDVARHNEKRKSAKKEGRKNKSKRHDGRALRARMCRTKRNKEMEKGA